MTLLLKKFQMILLKMKQSRIIPKIITILLKTISKLNNNKWKNKIISKREKKQKVESKQKKVKKLIKYCVVLIRTQTGQMAMKTAASLKKILNLKLVEKKRKVLFIYEKQMLKSQTNKIIYLECYK